MKIRIRPMEKEDIPSIVSIIKSHNEIDGKASERYYRNYFENPTCMESKSEQNFTAINDKTGSIIGVCGFAPDKYSTPDILWLNWFYVDNSNRGKGSGRELYQYTYSIIRALGTRKVYLETSSDPIYARAIKFYKMSGFKIEGKLIDYYQKGEDMVIMSLNLKESL